jgi:hypothetical protein
MVGYLSVRIKTTQQSAGSRMPSIKPSVFTGFNEAKLKIRGRMEKWGNKLAQKTVLSRLISKNWGTERRWNKQEFCYIFRPFPIQLPRQIIHTLRDRNADPVCTSHTINRLFIQLDFASFHIHIVKLSHPETYRSRAPLIAIWASSLTQQQVGTSSCPTSTF